VFDSDRARTIIQENSGPLKPILIACAIGGAFGAGTLLARSETPAGLTVPSVDVVAEVERKTAQLDEKRKELKLTFAKALETKEAPAKLPALPKGKTAPATETTDAHAGAPAELPPPPAPVAAKPAADDDDDDDGAPPEPVKPKADVQKSIAKVLGSEVAPKADAKEARAQFALQVASTPQKDAAEALAKKLADAGHKARVVEAELEGKGRVYRVRVGSFSERAAADAYKAKLAMPSFVIASD
jgi:cell division protein FtsN